MSTKRKNSIATALILMLALPATLLVMHISADHPGYFGKDYYTTVWYPPRQILNGLNPYATSPLHAPISLLIALPTTLFPFKVGYALYTYATIVVTYFSLLLAVPLRSSRSSKVFAFTGFFVAVSLPFQTLLFYGQMTAFSALGVMLVLRFPRTWISAIGLVLILLLPIMGVAFSIWLLALSRTREVVRGWSIAIVGSIVPLVWAVFNAGGLGGFVADNAQYAQGFINFGNRLDLPGQWAGGYLWASAIGALVVGLVAWWLYRSKPELNAERMLGLVALSLLAYYSIPYYLLMALVAGAAMLGDSKKWKTLNTYAVLMFLFVLDIPIWWDNITRFIVIGEAFMALLVVRIAVNQWVARKSADRFVTTG